MPPKRKTAKKNLQEQDIRLVIEIKNDQPLELIDLTKSLNSLANEFTNYVSRHGDSAENRAAKLYVKEIRSGSVICELIELATIGVLPFMENMNTIIGFGQYVSSAYKYLLGKKKEKPTDLTQSDLKELSQIVNPIAKDNGSQINISTTVNGNVELHIHLNSIEANAVQNVIEREIEQAKLPETVEDVKTKMVLTWFQARSDIQATTGNKGTIEEISQRPMNVIFENDEIKEKMIHGTDNPFNTAYVVDVKLQKVQGNIVAYKVTQLHETFEIT